MTETEIKAGLTTLDEKHPFYVALLALVESDVEDETSAALAPDLTDAARHFNAGRMAHARDFRNVIAGAVRTAWTEKLKAEQKLQRQKDAESS